MNSIQCYTELNNVLNKKIQPILTITNEINTIETKSQFDLLEQEAVFTFPNEQFDVLNPVYTFDSNSNTIPVPASNTQFDETFFEDIGDLLQNDFQEDIIETTPSYTELNSVNQQDLNANLATNFLYTNNFLNTTNQQADISLEMKQEILVDVKTKSGSGIKITRLNKSNKIDFCLSPSSSSQSMDTNESKIQLSPTSIENNLFTKVADNVKLNNNNNKKTNTNLLPWEVSHKSSNKRNGFKSKISDQNNEDNSIFTKTSVKPANKSLTKSDLSFNTINRKQNDFGKEKGAMLKKALLEDSSFLSLTKLVNNNNSSIQTNNLSAKDLVLNVLKKRTLV